MPFSQVFTEKNGYLLCITDGTVSSSEEFIEWAKPVFDKSASLGITKVLFDNRTFNLRLSSLEIVTFADQLESLGVAILGLRLAVVPSPMNPDESRMVETAITNRSGSYKIFKTQEEAKEWLLS